MPALRGAGAVFLGAFMMLSWKPSAEAQPLPTQITGDALTVNPKDAASLLAAAVPRTMRNHRAAMAFTYGIQYRNRNFSTHGKLLTDYSAKYEVIFVEGLPYRRQIEENQRPLTGPEAAQEQRRYDQAFAERSRMTLDQKRDYLKRPWNVDVPLPMLGSLFASTVVGEDVVDGRPAIVVESIPRSDVRPADEEERRALHKRVKLWIDREDLIVSRIEATLVADDAAMKKGTVARIDFFRKDGVWLPAQSDVRFEAVDDGEIVRGETMEVNDDFHRFHVDVRLLEPAEPAADPAQAQ
jgi:hypothetical protein